MIRRQNISDAQLLKQSVSDDSAFAKLINRYEARLQRYIARISSLDQASIEDCLQEVFLKVYRNIAEYDEAFTFSSWIYRITRNEVISFVRKKQARYEINFNLEDDQDLINHLPADLNLPAEFDRQQRAEKLHQAIKLLPQKYQEVIVLYYFEEKNYQEISDILCKTIGHISILLNRAKNMLKQYYEKD